MNRRTFTASLAGLLGLVGLGAKAKAAPKPAGRTLNVRGPVTLTAEAGQFDTVNVYPGGTLTMGGGHAGQFGTMNISHGAFVGREA